MNDEDQALKVSNVRLVSAVYFGLLAIIGTIFIDTILYLLGLAKILPIFKSILLSFILAACFGALFANKITHCKKPYKLKAFGYGFLMVMLILPIYNLGILLMMYQEHTQMFASASFIQMVYVYLIYLFFIFILAGLWMAIAAGLAAIYLRSRLVYDILHSQNVNRSLSVKKQTKFHRSTTPHRTREQH